MHLLDYAKRSRDAELIEVSHYTGMMTATAGMIDCLTVFERIRDTPIPMAYKVHLKQTILLYLIALPIQLVSTLG
ncbi:hypothetical protein HK405_015402, partial [Cladochytrium tenue]